MPRNRRRMSFEDREGAEAASSSCHIPVNNESVRCCALADSGPSAAEPAYVAKPVDMRS